MEDDIDPEFKDWVRMHEWLEWLAQYMREEARVALEAAQRLEPGA